jgi:hypothetical protein
MSPLYFQTMLSAIEKVIQSLLKSAASIVQWRIVHFLFFLQGISIFISREV